MGRAALPDPYASFEHEIAHAWDEDDAAMADLVRTLTSEQLALLIDIEEELAE